MTDLTPLGLEFRTVGGEAANRAADQYTEKVAKAEKATDALAGSQKKAGSATAQMLANIEKAVVELVEIARAQGQAGSAAEAFTRQQQAAATATERATASYRMGKVQLDAHVLAFQKAQAGSKLLGHEMLNLSRQFSDIGVTAAMGMNPLMILVQQGPQIAETLAVASARGVSFKAALIEMAVAAWAFLAPWAGIVAVLGLFAGAVLLAVKYNESLSVASKQVTKDIAANEKAIKAYTDAADAAAGATDEMRLKANQVAQAHRQAALDAREHAKAELDVARATLASIKAENAKLGQPNGNPLAADPEAMMGRAFFQGGNESKAAANLKARAKAYEEAATAVSKADEKLYGGARRYLQALQDQNAEFGKSRAEVIRMRAEKEASATTDAKLAAQIREAGRVSAANAAAEDAARASRRAGVQANRETDKEAAAAARSLATEIDRIKRESEQAAEALKQLEGRVKSLTDAFGDPAARQFEDRMETIREALKGGLISPEEFNEWATAIQAAKDAADFTLPPALPEITKATEGLKVGMDGLPQSSHKAEQAILDFADAAADLRYSIEGALFSLKNGDWAGAAAGVVRAIQQIRQAQQTGGTLGAATTAGAAAGSIIGGRAGSAIGGAAAGAQLGTLIAPGIGTAIGAVVGFIGGLLGGGGAKKREQQERERQAREAEAQRQEQIRLARQQQEIATLQLEGKTREAVLLQRKYELEAMDESLRAGQERIYQLQDEAEATAKAQQIATTARGIQIETLEAQGRASEALAMRRADELEELRKLDPALVSLKQALYDAQDAALAAAAAQQAANDNLNTALDARTKAENDLRGAYQRTSGEIKATRDKFQGLTDSLHETWKSLSPSGSGSRADFDRLASAAIGDDATAMGQLGDAARQQVEFIKSSASSDLEAARGIAQVRKQLQLAEEAARVQVSIADQQLAALEAQVGMLIQVRDAVLTVPQAIANLASAIAGVRQAETGVAVANATGSGVTQNGSVIGFNGKSVDLANVAPWIADSIPGALRDYGARGVEETFRQAELMGIDIPGFARGGSGVVGGSGGPDSKLVSMRLTPGELVNIRPPGEDEGGDLVSEIRALRAELQAIRGNTGKSADIADKLWALAMKLTLGRTSIRVTEVSEVEAA